MHELLDWVYSIAIALVHDCSYFCVRANPGIRRIHVSYAE